MKVNLDSKEKARKRKSITTRDTKALSSFFTFKTFLAFSWVASNWGKLVARTRKLQYPQYWTVYKIGRNFKRSEEKENKKMYVKNKMLSTLFVLLIMAQIKWKN